MFVLSNYFRNYSSYLRNEIPMKTSETEKEEPFSSFKSGSAFYHAKLAGEYSFNLCYSSSFLLSSPSSSQLLLLSEANCCVALGKAHCAAVHTEGDLLLMSAYSRGSVPIERQLAQMLFEVPHHLSSYGAGARGHHQFEAEFTLTELSMQQAEDLASSIKALNDGTNILPS